MAGLSHSIVELRQQLIVMVMAIDRHSSASPRPLRKILKSLIVKHTDSDSIGEVGASLMWLAEYDMWLAERQNGTNGYSPRSRTVRCTGVLHRFASIGRYNIDHLIK